MMKKLSVATATVALLATSASAVKQRAWISEAGESDDFAVRASRASQASPVIVASDGEAASAVFEESSSLAARLAAQQADIAALEKREEDALLWQQQALERVSRQQKAVQEEEHKMEVLVQMQKFLSSKAHRTPLLLHSAALALRTAIFTQLGAAAAGDTWALLQIASATYFVLVLVLSLLYAKHFTYPYGLPSKDLRQQVDSKFFSYGLFDALRCDPDARIPAASCCCLPIRWSDTASSSRLGAVPFWPTILLASGLVALSVVSFGVSVLFFVTVAVLNRQRIRSIYGMPSGTCGSCMGDCLVWTCCPCCATMQEAMQIEFISNPHFLSRLVQDSWLETPAQQIIHSFKFDERREKSPCC